MANAAMAAAASIRVKNFWDEPLACIIHEDSASRINIAKQVAWSPEERGSPRDEGDRARCDAPTLIKQWGSGVE